MAGSADEVAAFLVERLGPLRTGRLQALAYYAQAWHLAFHREGLFGDEVEAWAAGPVVRRLYDQHRGRDKVSAWPGGDSGGLDQRALAVLAWVLHFYGSFTGDELCRIARAEAPWLLTRGGRRRGRRSGEAIDPIRMADYYGRLGASPDVAVAVAVGSARLEGHEFGPHMADRLREAAAGTRAADEIVAEVIHGYQKS
jgi:uncharacterized phage-associated protein